MRERHAGKAWTPVNQEKNGIAALPTADEDPLVDTAQFDLLQRVDAFCRGNLDPLSGPALPGYSDRSDQDDEAGQKQSQNHDDRYLFVGSLWEFLASVCGNGSSNCVSVIAS